MRVNRKEEKNVKSFESLCSLRCLGCRYFFPARDVSAYFGMLPACCYILEAGRRRPCPAGDQCTVYESRDSRTASHIGRVARSVETGLGLRRLREKRPGAHTRQARRACRK